MQRHALSLPNYESHGSLSFLEPSRKLYAPVNVYTREAAPRIPFCTLHLSHDSVTRRCFPVSSRRCVASLARAIPILEFRGRALTVFQILSPVRSYSPDLLYQNALAAVGIQAFGEHISRSLGDSMSKLTSLFNPQCLHLLALAMHGRLSPEHADLLRKGRPMAAAQWPDPLPGWFCSVDMTSWEAQSRMHLLISAAGCLIQ